MIRAKMHLANDFNYRESRWFTAWEKVSNFSTLFLCVFHFFKSYIFSIGKLYGAA